MQILKNFLKNIAAILACVLAAMTLYFLIVSFVNWKWSIFTNPFELDAKFTILIICAVSFLNSFDVDNDSEDTGPL